MLRIAEGDLRFNLRAVALVRRGDDVLLQRDEADAFATLPGGRVEWGESGEQTIRREMAEELGAEVEVGALRLVAENRFALRGLRFHELDLWFDARLPEGSPLLATEGFVARDDPRVRFFWAPVGGLGRLDPPLLPAFAVEALAAPAPGVRHVVVG